MLVGKLRGYMAWICPLPTAHCPLPTAHCPLPAGSGGARNWDTAVHLGLPCERHQHDIGVYGPWSQRLPRGDGKAQNNRPHDLDFARRSPVFSTRTYNYV
jgi:hypothetical protein